MRSGGYGGLRMRSSLDVDADDPTQQHARELVDGVLAAARSAASAPSRADGFQYDLTIERGSDQTKLTVHDPVPPGPLGELIELMQQRAEL